MNQAKTLSPCDDYFLTAFYFFFCDSDEICLGARGSGMITNPKSAPWMLLSRWQLVPGIQNAISQLANFSLDFIIV